MDVVPAAKRPRRAAATAADLALAGSETSIAEVMGISESQSVALTSQDELERHSTEGLFGKTPPSRTAVVTLHTNVRPSCLPKQTVHIGAAFEDTADFEDGALSQHLRLMTAYVWSASALRVVFVCNAGVNRSTLALCFYSATYGRMTWEQARSALVAAKGGAARGWPTLQNTAFESFLARRFGSSSASERSCGSTLSF